MISESGYSKCKVSSISSETTPLGVGGVSVTVMKLENGVGTAVEELS